MNRPAKLATAVLAVAAVGLPTGSAQAASASKTKAKSVAVHVKKAQGAQARVATLVRRNDVKGAKRVLRIARHEATVAARQARALATSADASTPAAQSAVFSITSAAGNFGTAIEQFAALLPQASAAMQQALASAIPGSIAGRESLMQSLTDLVSSLSGTGQSLAAQALAALQTSSPSQVQAIAETAATDLPAQIEDIINRALTAASEALKTGISELTAILPQLPEDAQTPVAGALSMFSSLIDGIVPIIQQTTSMVTNIVSQVLDLVKGLMPNFGAFLGGGSSQNGGSTPSSGGLFGGGGLLGGLLNGITGLIPGFGGGFFGGLLG